MRHGGWAAVEESYRRKRRLRFATKDGWRTRRVLKGFYRPQL